MGCQTYNASLDLSDEMGRWLYHYLGNECTCRERAPLSTGSVLNLEFCSIPREGQTYYLLIRDQGKQGWLCFCIGTPGDTCILKLDGWRGQSGG